MLIYSLQIAEPDKQTSVSSGMESELVNQGDDRTTQNNQHEEKTEDRKEPSHSLSRRRSSPSSRQRNYRKRSVSESPEKSPPRRSPENSPSSRKRSRNSDFRGNKIILRYLIQVLKLDVRNLFVLASRSVSINLCLNRRCAINKMKHRNPQNTMM